MEEFSRKNKKSKTEKRRKTKRLSKDMVQFLTGISKREKMKGGKFPEINGRKYPKLKDMVFGLKEPTE